MRIVIRVLLVLVIVGHCETSAQDQRWLSYEPAIVELEGRLTTESKYGPPNYGERPKTDQKVKVPILVLTTPINVRGTPGDAHNALSVKGIKKIQLAFTDATYKEFIGKDVVVKGQLFHAFTGHHYTEVVMSVRSVEGKSKALPRAMGQDFSPREREQLTRAEKTADAFVKRFRQTLDFGLVWKEFRAEQFSCRLIKSDIVTNVSDDEKLRIGIPLLEKAYIALMNVYYLKGVHDLSLARMESNMSDEQITPREIQRAENSGVYVRTNGKTPKTAKEIEEYIVELNRMVKLYRKHMPRNVMASAAWRANEKYLTSRGGIDHLAVHTGHPDFCIAEDQKYFIVDRGVFYFYMVEEHGQMKIAELAVGN